MDEEILKFFKWNELMDFFFKAEIDVVVLSMFFFNTNFRDPFNLIMCVFLFSTLKVYLTSIFDLI